MQNLRRSIIGAIAGVAIAVGFGIGANQLHASVATASAVDCDTVSVCPVKAADACPTDAAKAASACPTDAAKAVSTEAEAGASCKVSKDASI